MQEEADGAKSAVTSSRGGPRKKLKLTADTVRNWDMIYTAMSMHQPTKGAISSTSTVLRPIQVAVIEDTDNNEVVADEKESEEELLLKITDAFNNETSSS